MLIGNGYIGVVLAADSQLHIKSDRTLSFAINFYPVIEFSVNGLKSAGKSILFTGIEYYILLHAGVVYQCPSQTSFGWTG